MGDNKTKSFYLPPDVVEYLETHENASAEVTRLVRRQMLRDEEAAAYQRIHGVPLSEAKRVRARSWAREQLSISADKAAEKRAELDELRRRMGWAG